jgi:hypothetical protein
MPKLKIDYSQVKNNIKFDTQYDFYDEKYDRTDLYIDQTSFEKFQRLLPKKSEKIELMGLNGLGGLIDTDISQITGEISSVIFDKFGKEVISIECEVFYSDVCDELGNFLKIGNYVYFFHNNVMEWKGTDAGTRGIYESTTDLILYARINLDEWGDYTDNLESNDAIMLLDGTKEDVNVSSVITSNFFTGNQSISYAYLKSVDWFTMQGVTFL